MQMTILLLILVYAVVAFFQIPGLVRKKYWYELVVFSCFLIFAFVFSLLLGIGIKIPSPLEIVKQTIQNPFKLHY